MKEISELTDIKKAINGLFNEKKERWHRLDVLDGIWENVATALGYPNYKIDHFAAKYIKYFSSMREDYYPELKINPNKGLLSMGDFGNGKTLNFRIYQYIYTKININVDGIVFPPLQTVNDDKFIICYVREIESKLKLEGEIYIDKLCRVKTLVIDDLGDEKDDFKDYGTSRNPIVDVMRQRYDKMYTLGLRTHFTTNKNAKELKARYGDIVIDRIKEMTIQISVKGKSKRV